LDIAAGQLCAMKRHRESLNGEDFYSLKEGQAKILRFLLLPRAAANAALRSLFGGAMGMLS
jgi:hypothetical protein